MLRGVIYILLSHLFLFGCGPQKPDQYNHQNRTINRQSVEDAIAAPLPTPPSIPRIDAPQPQKDKVVRLGVPVLRVEPSRVQLTPGQSQDLHFFYESHGVSQDVTADVALKSQSMAIDIQRDDQQIIHVSGLELGEGEIEASYDDVHVNVDFAVQLPQAVGLKVVPEIFDLEPGTSQVYRVNGVMPDGSMFDVTHMVRWDTVSDDVVGVQEGEDGALHVTAKSPGTWTLVAASMGMLHKVNALVQQYPVTGLTAEPSLVVLELNEQIEISVFLQRGGFDIPASEDELMLDKVWEGVEVEWRHGKLLIKPRGEPGEGLVRLVYNEQSLEIPIVVQDQQPLYLRLIAPDSIEQGMSRQISVYAVYPSGSVQDVSMLAFWEIEGKYADDIAQIHTYQKKKKMEALSEGNVQIRARWSGMTVIKNIPIIPTKPKALELTASRKNFAVGSFLQLRAQTISQNRVNQVSCEIHWSVQKTDVVELVDRCGRFRGLKAGQTKVFAAWHELTAEIILEVSPSPLKSIHFAEQKMEMVVAQKRILKLFGRLEDGRKVELDPKILKVQAQSPFVAAVQSIDQNITVKAIQTGQTQLIARYEDLEGRADLQVVKGDLNRIQIVPENLEMSNGHKVSLLVVGYYDDGSRRNITQDVSWGVEDSSIAQVKRQNDGLFMLESYRTGETVLYARFDQYEAQAQVRVVEGAFESLVIEPEYQEMTFDDDPTTGRNVAVYGVLANGRRVDVMDQVVLRSLTPSVLEVDPQQPGRFIDRGMGYGSIEASLGELSAMAGVEVQKPREPVVSLMFDGSVDDRDVEKGHMGRLSWNGGLGAKSCEIQDEQNRVIGVEPQGEVAIEILEDQTFYARCENILGESDQTQIQVRLLRDLRLTPAVVEIREGGQQQQFKAEFIHAFGPADVIWEVIPPIGEDGGFIDQDGLYTSPKNVDTRVDVRVKATLKSDHMQSVQGMIHINPEETIFVRCTQDQKQFPIAADVYQISEDTTHLPNDSEMSAIDHVCMDTFNVPSRRFTEGFPNVPHLIEWFALKAHTKLTAPKTGVYTLTLISDDGAQLFLDEQLVIDNDGLHLPQSKSVHVYMEEGQSYDLGLHYFQGPRFYIALQLFWTVPQSGASVIIPKDAFQ